MGTLGVSSLISGSVGLGDSTITQSPSTSTSASDVTFTTTNSNGQPILGVSLGSGGVTLGVGSLISGSVGLGGDSTITSSPSQSTSASDVTFTTTNSAGEPILGVSLGSGGVTLGVSGLVSASVGGDSTITSSPSLSSSASDVTFTTTNSNGEPLIGVSLGSGGVSLGVGGTGGGLV